MRYENNWASLNTRPVPDWFGKAKFGIFIHWGLYSVPAFEQKGKYAEWYGMALEYAIQNGDTNSPVYRFHQKTYGMDVKYADFVRYFKAELFDAHEWVSLFKKAGAKYINFVSKHHDGFCMYKSDYAPFWNSVDVGPHRDFCAELRDACEGSGVCFGVYHSLYEWWHPDYLRNPEEYALRHLHPMLKELVDKYQPHTLFTDGEWMQPSSVWHSTEFLQWLYNESAVRDVIVPNDRWGSETRGSLGGNFTTEYGEVSPGRILQQVDLRPFEECRGLGASFGLNRMETVGDYMSAKEIIKLLLSLVSKGGNLLLNVGPAADGTIPVIMQERLLEIGRWLDVNGEAIYGSEQYRTASDARFYYTQKDHRVYAMTETYPSGTIVFDSIPYANGTVKLLGLHGNRTFPTIPVEGRTGVILPFISPDELDAHGFYAFEITETQAI